MTSLHNYSQLIAWIYAFSCIGLLIYLAKIDLKTFRLPNVFTYPLIFCGIAYNTLSSAPFCSIAESCLGALLGFLILWVANRLYRFFRNHDGMGMGDAKLLSGIGAILGINTVLPLLLLASILGSIGGLIWLKLNRQSLKNYFPFGPYLALAGILGILDEVLTLNLLKSLSDLSY